MLLAWCQLHCVSVRWLSSSTGWLYSMAEQGGAAPTHLARLLHELFEDDERIQQQYVPQIPGLTFIPEYFSQQQQDNLLQQVSASGWFKSDAINSSKHTSIPPANPASTCQCSRDNQLPDSGSNSSGKSNQVMVFGVNNMPAWLQEMAQKLPLQEHWPAHLANREPAFDTAIINLYTPGDGITPHVDLLRFSDGIAIISLGDPTIMEFSRAETAPTYVAAAAAGNAGDSQACCGGCSGPQQQQQQQHHHQQQASPQRPGASPAVHSSSSSSSSHQEICPADRKQHAASVCGAIQPAPAASLQHQLLLQGGDVQQQQQQLLLQGGDALLLHGEARYGWQHGIAAAEQEVLLCASCKAAAAAATTAATTLTAVRVCAEKANSSAECRECKHIVRGRRVSITLRRLDPAQRVLDMV